jgi:bromodomain adjacent to zinc finger domain protein 1A
MIAGDLKIPAKDANAKDEPTKYFYELQILELEKDKSHDKHRTMAKGGKEDDRTGTTIDVQCNLMRCDLIQSSCR